MSRAFLREADAPEPRCPEPAGCGGRGVSVTEFTLRAHVGEEAVRELRGELFLCPDPHCDVAYFDAAHGRLTVDRLRAHGWPKDPDAPVCPCVGVTENDVEDFARDGRTDLMRAFLARTEGPEARCLARRLDGQSCVTDARRIFLAARGGG